MHLFLKNVISFDFKNWQDVELKINSGKDYITISSELGIDWTAEVANIHTLDAKELSDADLINRKTEFLNTLKSTPLSQLFSTTSGIIDKSTIQNFMK